MICKYFVCAFLIGVLNNAVPAVSRARGPPRLVPSSSDITLQLDDDVRLHCEGQEPVRWILPDQPQHSQAEPSSMALINMSEAASTPDQGYPYGIVLEISGVQVENVGYYVCVYNDTYSQYNSDPSNLDDLVDNDAAAAIYIYVEDEDNLFIKPNPYITANQMDNVIIPCRPSFPDVKVTIYKDEEMVVASYDPKKGFEFRALSLTDSGDYQCFFTSRKNDTQQTDILLFLNTRTTSVAPPEITQEGANSGHAIEGHPLVLHCRVNVTVLGVTFKLTWSTPDIKTLASYRVQESETIQKKIDNILHGESNLTIYNVTKEDEGNYKCVVTDSSHNTNSVSRYIRVVNPNTSYIRLSESTNKTEMIVKSGTAHFQWRIKIDAFPSPKLIWYNPRGDEIQAGWGDRNSHYEIKNTLDSSLFKINDVDIMDSGVYQLRAMTVATEAVYNITLRVKVQPEVQLATLEPAPFYMLNKLALLECYLTGYPLPIVEWRFLACPRYPQCEKASKPLPAANITTVHTSEFILTSTLKMNATTTGYVYCIGKNELGTKNTSENFFITDMDDRYSVWPAPPYHVQDSKIEVALGENLTLWCGASVFNYTNDLNWVHITDDDNYSLQPSEDTLITTDNTPYSYRTSLTFNSMRKDQSGQYGCRANKLDYENLYDSTYISVIVKDLQEPAISQSNMNGSDIPRALGDPLKLYCVVDGVPAPDIAWYKDGEEMIISLLNDTRISLEQNSTLLHLRYMRLQDEGTYSCAATNKVGQDVRTAYVYVSNKPGLHVAVMAVLISITLLFIFCIVFLVYRVKKEKKLRKELAIAGLAHFEEGALDSINPELGVDEQAELLPYDRKWEFPRDKLKLGKQLGSGAFGVVLKAEARGICEGEDTTTVAVKMVKRTADPAFIKALASELKVMVHLGKHLNVVNLLGACTKNVTKRELLVIVEFCRFGNIHNYLLRHRNAFINQIDPETGRLDPTIGEELLQRSGSIGSADFTMYATSATTDSDNSGYLPPISGGANTANTGVTLVSMTPTGEEPLMSNNSVQPEWRSNYRGDYREQNVRPVCTQDLLCWAFQVARGMEYLASRKVLHGDLAARNILLAEDNVVKICDFGLARSMYKDDNYQKKGEGPLPVKWMAIESIRDRVFSTQSDVWSFGVTMWELFSLARTPYPGMEANEKLYMKLVEGYRMERPQFANEAIYQTMMDCWHASPTSRPSFTDLTSSLGGMLEDSVRIHYVDLNDPYLTMNSTEGVGAGGDYLAMMSSPDITQLQAPLSNPPNYVNAPNPTGQPGLPLIDGAACSDYLCMSPSKTVDHHAASNPNQNGGTNFQFPSPDRAAGGRSAGDRHQIELTPMLADAATHSDAESEPHTPPSQSRTADGKNNAVANPSYHKLFDKPPWVPNGAPTSNYVNVVTPNNNLLDDKDSSRLYVN